ncbi:MAG: nuclear transport factor 2 family protein [Gemmatimonadetes bacterium]|nr:nuclear transport factor 2 family protein [Gemmatimonadota bacterium]
MSPLRTSGAPRCGAAALGCLALSACVAAPAFDASTRAAVETEIRGTLRAFEAAVATGDARTIASYYADRDDFLWLEDGRVSYESVGAVEASIAAVAGQMSFSRLTLSESTITALDPNAAHVTMLFDQSFGADADTIRYSGAMSAAMVRTEDGWKFLRGHTSTPSRRDS